ncbi:MAG: hypothetical protein FJ308_13735 [Planctomycetes bacterium]|nr:hypothetical protein [Planctomycetota bacterium]
MKVGSAIYFSDLESPKAINWNTQPHQRLKGWVRFDQVDSELPIHGEFDFVTEYSVPLKGRFEARWLKKNWLGD